MPKQTSWSAGLKLTSYFGGKRQRGRQGKRKRGRGTLKQPVIGVFERGGRVYTEIVSDCSG